MAEGGGTSGEEELLYDSSLSDFVFDFFCELCIDDGKHVEAEGFCVDCGEYLCGTCYNGHRLSRPSRHHVLLDKENMPRDTPLTTDRISKDISTKCKCKGGDVVKFYCKSHEFLGCTTCFATVHNNCVDRESILEKSEAILDSQDYKDFITMLKDLQTKARDIISQSRENQASAKRLCTQTTLAVRKFKEEVIEILNEIEQSFLRDAEEIMTEDNDRIETITKESTTMLEKIQGISADVDELHASRRVCQLYIQMQENMGEVTALREVLKETEKKNTVREYPFEPNDELKSYLRGQDIFGTFRQTVRIQVDTSMVKVAHVVDIDVTSNDDVSRNYCINGLTMLPNNKFAFVDRSFNYKVCLFDTNTMKETSRLILSSFPSDVTVAGENQIAVTLRESGKILIVNVSDKLTIDRELTVEKECRGVAYNKGRLFVTFARNPRLEIMDLRGNVLRKIETSDDGSKLFVSPEYVCLSNDLETVYVSDSKRHQVIRLTMDGKVTSIYEDSEMKGPTGVCSDEYGHVYVSGEQSRNVHMITADCSKIKVILKQEDGLRDTRSVSYCKKTNRLFVGQSNKMVKVFVLSF